MRQAANSISILGELLSVMLLVRRCEGLRVVRCDRVAIQLGQRTNLLIINYPHLDSTVTFLMEAILKDEEEPERGRGFEQKIKLINLVKRLWMCRSTGVLFPAVAGIISLRHRFLSKGCWGLFPRG
jgi:hypothetical protein